MWESILYSESTTIVAVGGLGGSGTRVITSLLREHGVDMGSSLNAALDNLFFTLLFRRPSWFDILPSHETITRAVNVFYRNLQGSFGEFYSIEDQEYVENLLLSGDVSHFTSDQWIARISKHFESSSEQELSQNLIGWKEPNTHMFIQPISAVIPRFKYIHLIRDGLYMSQSKNQNQLKMWAGALGVDLIEPVVCESNALNFWYEANLRAISYGNTSLKNNFYLANYDVICQNPKHELKKILEFVGVEARSEKIKMLSESISYKLLLPKRKYSVLKKMDARQIANYESLMKMCQ